MGVGRWQPGGLSVPMQAIVSLGTGLYTNARWAMELSGVRRT